MSKAFVNKKAFKKLLKVEALGIFLLIGGKLQKTTRQKYTH